MFGFFFPCVKQRGRCPSLFTAATAPIYIEINEVQAHFHWEASMFFDSPILFSSLSFVISCIVLHLHPPLSLQLEPRPFETLSQWTWSWLRSSGRRNMRRKKRRTGQWRRPFRDWRLSWSSGGAVILPPLPGWSWKQWQWKRGEGEHFCTAFSLV